MSPTIIRNKEETSNDLSSAFKAIAKNFLLLPDIARDLNIIRQNLVEYAKIKGAEVSTTPDSSFIPEKDFTPTPTPVKKEEKAKPAVVKKKSFLSSIIESFSPQNLLKSFASLFNPKNFIKLLGRIAIVAMVAAAVYEGFTAAWDKWKESGSIWEAIKEGAATVTEFVTFGLIDKETMKSLYQGAADLIKPFTDPIVAFFTKMTDWFSEKWSTVKEFFGFKVEKKAPPATPQAEQLVTPEILKGKKPEKELTPQEQAAAILQKPSVKPTVTPPSPAPTPTPTPAAAAPAPAARAPSKAVKKEEGVPKPAQKISGMEDVKKMIIRHEGVRNEPYKDSLGLWTVGVGHLIGNGKSLPDSWNRKFSDEEVMNLFEEDFAHHVKIAQQTPSYDKANEGGKGAFIDLAFNMGKWWPKWPGTKAKLEDEDFAGAAAGLENSKWYTQVGNRAKTIVALVEQADDGKGQKIAQASTSLAVGQREQQKSATPVIINKPTTNNTHITNNQMAQTPRDTNSATQALVYRAA
jgi:lysozyme